MFVYTVTMTPAIPNLSQSICQKSLGKISLPYVNNHMSLPIIPILLGSAFGTIGTLYVAKQMPGKKCLTPLPKLLGHIIHTSPYLL